MKTYVALVGVLIFISSNLYSQYTWYQSDGPYLFDVTAITALNDSKLICSVSGSGFNGMFSYNNPTNLWETLTPNGTYQALEFWQTDGHKVFADLWGSFGVSKDNGATWKILNSNIYNGFIDTHVVNDTVLYLLSYKDLYKSYSSGDSWELLYSGSENQDYSSILVTNNNTIYTSYGTIWYETGGLSKSTDDGQSWQDMGFVDIHITDMIELPAGEIFFGSDSGLVNFSSDNGANWQQRSNGLPKSKINKFFVKGNDSLFALTETNGIYITTDYGSHWEAFNSGLRHLKVYDITYDRLTGNLFIATGGSIYKWDKIQNEWTTFNQGLPRMECYNLALDKNGSNEQILYLATHGIFRSDDNAATWEHFPQGSFTYEFTLTRLKVNRLGTLFAIHDFFVYKSTDQGKNWSQLIINVDTLFIPRFLYLDENDRLYIITDQNKIFFTEDEGITWTLLKSNGLPDFTRGGMFCRTYNGLYEIYLSVGAKIYKSTDDGNTWQQLLIWNAQYPANTMVVTSIGKFANQIIAGSYGNGIKRSTDGGITWEDFQKGITDKYIQTIISNSNGDIFACAARGIYKAEENGWKSIGPNKNLYFNSMICDKYEHLVVGCGATQGVFRTNESTLTDIDEDENKLPEKFSLSQNYPNPFNPTTVISFQLSVYSKTQLKIYDVLGREVAGLMDEYKNPGAYQVEFDASNLSSGIYFYKLQAGEYSAVRKMMLVK